MQFMKKHNSTGMFIVASIFLLIQTVTEISSTSHWLILLKMVHKDCEQTSFAKLQVLIVSQK